MEIQFTSEFNRSIEEALCRVTTTENVVEIPNSKGMRLVRVGSKEEAILKSTDIIDRRFAGERGEFLVVTSS